MSETTARSSGRGRVAKRSTGAIARLSRFMMSKRRLVEAQALLVGIVERLSPVEHLTETPPIESSVRLLKDSWYLGEYHGATVGSVGTVVMHSRLNPDDDGVLVDWGSGVSVRCSLYELAQA